MCLRCPVLSKIHSFLRGVNRILMDDPASLHVKGRFIQVAERVLEREREREKARHDHEDSSDAQIKNHSGESLYCYILFQKSQHNDHTYTNTKITMCV